MTSHVDNVSFSPRSPEDNGIQRSSINTTTTDTSLDSLDSLDPPRSKFGRRWKLYPTFLQSSTQKRGRKKPFRYFGIILMIRSCFQHFFFEVPYFKVHQLPEIYFVSRIWALSPGIGWFWMESFYGELSKMKGYDEIWWVYIYYMSMIRVSFQQRVLAHEFFFFRRISFVVMILQGEIAPFSPGKLTSPLKINGWKMDILLLSLSLVFRGVCCWCIHSFPALKSWWHRDTPETSAEKTRPVHLGCWIAGISTGKHFAQHLGRTCCFG